MEEKRSVTGKLLQQLHRLPNRSPTYNHRKPLLVKSQNITLVLTITTIHVLTIPVVYKFHFALCKNGQSLGMMQVASFRVLTSKSASN